jgi:hypothetical protein
MIQRILRQVASSGMSGGRRGAPPSRFGGRRRPPARGGTTGAGASLGAALERYVRGRRR